MNSTAAQSIRSSATTVHVLGIRHHGPGSARMLVSALERTNPTCVLVEGPSDAADVLQLAANDAMRPPVALLVYEPDTPSHAAYYPFAEYSPEWQAIRWALRHQVELRFIDLPFARRLPEPAAGSEKEPPREPDPAVKPAEAPHTDPLDALATAAGFEDGEAWWGRLIEEHHGDHDPLGVFDAIREAMQHCRDQLGSRRHDADEPAREAHMRACVRAAVKEKFQRIVVVCGAWHAPALTAEALKRHTAKADDTVLKELPRRKSTATWIPWTYNRLSMFSGYGAGVVSPGWYEHVWHNRSSLCERWMARVARLMRDEDLDASPAHVIEGVRLAECLAAIRRRAAPGLEELNEATLAVLCAGNPLPLRLIHRRLIVGDALGEVPADTPTVPLQRDLASLQKTLRMKVSADEALLDLDQRRDIDLERSRLLHRLGILGVPWGRREHARGRQTSTFHELWRLQWKPEFAVRVIEAAVYGNTVATAANAAVMELASKSSELPRLTERLDEVLLADLPNAVDILVRRIQEVAAVAADVHHLMDAVPGLASVLRYGNVRQTDGDLVRPVLRGMVARVCAGLGPACASLDDESAAAMRVRLDGVDSALNTLNDADLLSTWRERLGSLGDAPVHALLAARCWRLLLDARCAEPEAVARRLWAALSRGNDPAKASAWIEGFLAGSGSILVHDQQLLPIIDTWVSQLTRDAFESICPILRRTFSTFTAPERRMLGERLRRGDGGAAMNAGSAVEDYDAARGELMLPVLRLILGEEVAWPCR